MMTEKRINSTAWYVKVGKNVVDNGLTCMLLLIKGNIPMEEKYSETAFWGSVLKIYIEISYNNQKKNINGAIVIIYHVIYAFISIHIFLCGITTNLQKFFLYLEIYTLGNSTI